MTDMAPDKAAIRELVENWALWRDARLWDRFRTVWHPEGRMVATWFDGTFEEFIKANDEGWSRGVRILHLLGGGTIDIAGHRAIAQTKMTISQRAPVEGVVCDVLCTGRFYDFLEKRGGRWGIVLRRAIYEQDRLDPVNPSARLVLDPDVLKRFPEGYRHLGYLQAKAGYEVNPHLPGIDGPELDKLYAHGARWLAGKRL
jgi:hypothetical protein